MKQVYIVTESDADIGILRKLLPSDIVKDVGFIAGSNRYGAHSLATSILAVKRCPVGLVMGTDTVDENVIQEQKEYIQELLQRASAGIQFGVFLVVPEIEAILFQDATLISEMNGQSVSTFELELAKAQPKSYLARSHKDAQTILDDLDSESLENLRRHPLIDELNQFLNSIIDEDN